MISKNTFLKAREMLSEANQKCSRASTLQKEEDYSGVVEASQHCVELAIKSLFVLFGMEPPHTHNPGKDLDRIYQALEHSYLSDENSRKIFSSAFSRVKWLSYLMEKLHTEGMYG
ncbi:HEPN domain-containing protein, partial [Candidatus Bathyarchaeota archaeon]|nr:HEPN domain-containing protein [Candidatus Bathyarchaeota archaeon]